MNPEELIKEVLRTIENNNSEDIAKELVKKELLHPSFEMRYLKNFVERGFKVIKRVNNGTDAVDFYLDDQEESPYKVQLIMEDKWYLKSFLFQCQGCFGEDASCQVCDGSGWGVL